MQELNFTESLKECTTQKYPTARYYNKTTDPLCMLIDNKLVGSINSYGGFYIFTSNTEYGLWEKFRYHCGWQIQSNIAQQLGFSNVYSLRKDGTTTDKKYLRKSLQLFKKYVSDNHKVEIVPITKLKAYRCDE